MEEFKNVTEIMDSLINSIKAGYQYGVPYVRRLIYFLLGIDVALLGIRAMFGQGANIGSMVKKILFIGCWSYIVFNLPQLAEAFLESLIVFGLKVSNNEAFSNVFKMEYIMTDPFAIIFDGVTLLFNMYIKLPNGIANIGIQLMGIIVFLVGSLCYGFIAILILVTTIEFHLLVLCSSILIAFTFIDQTKFIGEKTISAIAGSAIKVMVLLIIAGISIPLIFKSLQILTKDGDVKVIHFIYILLSILFTVYLCLQAPGIASSLLSGIPSISNGGIMGMVAGAASGAASSLSLLKASGGQDSSLDALKKIGRVATGAVESMGKNKGGGGMGKNQESSKGKSADGSLVKSTVGTGGASPQPGGGASSQSGGSSPLVHRMPSHIMPEQRLLIEAFSRGEDGGGRT